MTDPTCDSSPSSVPDAYERDWLKRKAKCDLLGVCVYSGMKLPACKVSVCDCFEHLDLEEKT